MQAKPLTQFRVNKPPLKTADLANLAAANAELIFELKYNLNLVVQGYLRIKSSKRTAKTLNKA